MIGCSVRWPGNVFGTVRSGSPGRCARRLAASDRVRRHADAVGHRPRAASTGRAGSRCAGPRRPRPVRRRLRAGSTSAARGAGVGRSARLPERSADPGHRCRRPRPGRPAATWPRPGQRPSTEVLRHRDVADLTIAERAHLRRAVRRCCAPPRRPALAAPAPPAATARRPPPHASGAALRAGGGDPALLHRRPGTAPAPGRAADRRLRLDGALRRRAAAVRARRRRGGPSAATEVFTIGTRLTRVTRGAAAARPGARRWRARPGRSPTGRGGTRLGEVLKAFLDRWGTRGTARGAVVVVF